MTDDHAVARLEAIIRAQQPAAEAWRPVTDYSFDARREAEGCHPNLVANVFKPALVLDAGCGPGHFVRLLRGRGLEARGFDVHPPPGEWFSVGDLTEATRPLGILWHSHDLVICREVLEHLTIRQIGRAVRNLVRLSSRFVYVTTRYAKHPDHLLSVETADDLDPTHITMLTKPFLRTLFVLEGCTSRPDLEQQLDWQGKGRCLVFEVP